MARWFGGEGARGRARIVAGVLCVLALPGCAWLGPRGIRMGQGHYAEVINQMEDRQVLNAIVRQRYDESAGMITVASVTASLRFRAQAGTEIGIGEDSAFAGNVVPLSAGIAYEENPTISYLPLTGEAFTRRMLSPVTLDEWLLLQNPSRRPGRVFDLVVRRANGLQNSMFREKPPSSDFARFLDLYDLLIEAAVLEVVRQEEGDDVYFWDIRNYQYYEESVREFLGLLGIEREATGVPILLPVRHAVGRPASAVHLQLRSAYEVLELFGGGIEVPEAHLEAGIVKPILWQLEEERRFITVQSSEDDPDSAAVKIRFRDWWFYVDATDTDSKRAFQLLRTFIGMRLVEHTGAQRGPVLTVPVN